MYGDGLTEAYLGARASSLHPGGASFAMADGSVRFIKDDDRLVADGRPDGHSTGRDPKTRAGCSSSQQERRVPRCIRQADPQRRRRRRHLLSASSSIIHWTSRVRCCPSQSLTTPSRAAEYSRRSARGEEDRRDPAATVHPATVSHAPPGGVPNLHGGVRRSRSDDPPAVGTEARSGPPARASNWAARSLGGRIPDQDQLAYRVHVAPPPARSAGRRGAERQGS